jgi:F1F0 ATPase subunit 2
MLVRLEMGEARMNFPPFDVSPAWTGLAGLAAYLVAGIALGTLYFRSFWWNVRRFADGGRLLATVALIVGRFVLLGAAFVLASRQGALPLLMMALGVFLARSAVMRRVREATP